MSKIKGIETEFGWIEFRGNKLVFQKKGDPNHYTFQFGNLTNVLDLHSTSTDGVHRTLAAITSDNLGLLCKDFFDYVKLDLNIPDRIELSNTDDFLMFMDKLPLTRYLRMGWIYHRNLAMRVNPSLLDVTRISKRKRHVFDNEAVRSNIDRVYYIKEIELLANGSILWIHKLKHGIPIVYGFAIKLSYISGDLYLRWFKLKELMHYQNKHGKKLRALWEKYAISQENYKDYPILTK